MDATHRIPAITLRRALIGLKTPLKGVNDGLGLEDEPTEFMTEYCAMNPGRGLDLEAYLERIGYEGPRVPDLETLRSLQAAHLSHIPFENLDVILRRGVSIDLDSLQAKLVRGRRGGYCFEQNSLFVAVLRHLGFEADTLEARVRPMGETETLPRTHMALRVSIDEESWLADVGFGGDGSFEPISFEGRVSRQAGGDYRLTRESDEIRVLQRRWKGVWTDLYAFGPTPALPVDYIVANHFTSTHPASIFLRVLTVQRFASDERHILRNQTYTIRRADEEVERRVEREEMPGLVASVFELELSEQEINGALDQNS